MIHAQTRAMSLTEAAANIAVGFAINFAGQIALYPLFGIHVSLGINLGIGAAFTAISLARAYCLRRTFERLRVLHG
jgi:uncharacterized membrane protein (DUF485 family)